MRFTQLRAFDAVARHGGFVAAAQQVGLTQPALTIQVRALEEDYALKLFKRKGGKVRLTQAGQQLFQLTRELFAVEDRVRDFLRESKELESGELRLSVDGPHLAMALIAAFQKRYPKIRLAVSSGNAHSVWRDLIDGRADVVVVANPPDNKRTDIAPIRESRLHVLVPINHPWASRDSVAVRELSAEPAVLREPRSNTRRTLDLVLKDSKTVLDVVMELGGREATLEAVAAGLGIGFVFAHEVSADIRVRSIPLSGTKYRNIDTVAALTTHRRRGVVDAFFSVVRDWSTLHGNLS
jgi:LysR family transcriptional regulator, low CO2-responsive transcriptional regulator